MPTEWAKRRAKEVDEQQKQQSIANRLRGVMAALMKGRR